MLGLNFRRGFAAAIGGISVVLMVAGSATAQKYVLKLGHPLPPKTGLHTWAVYLKAGIEKRAAGRMEVKIFPVSQLGTIPRMIEGAQLGTVEMITMPPAFFTGLDRRFGVLAAPGIFTGIEHGQRTVHDPEFKKVFWPIGEGKGLKMVGMSCRPARPPAGRYRSRIPVHGARGERPMKAVQVRISGRVQGVWFRAWTEQRATALGLGGWVRNCLDGDVEALFAGSGEAVDAMIAECWNGPPHARVSAVAADSASAPQTPGFHILPRR